MRVAVINYDKCKPEKCGYVCANVCPVNRSGGDPAISIDDVTGKPRISETLCIGCGICVKKCPFGAITIVNLPEEVGTPVHQYGPNMFRIYGLPYPREGKVIGILGRNGTGKSTAIKILSGQIIPNFGEFQEEPTWDKVIERFKGTELQAYFQKIRDKGVRISYKPQEIEPIPKIFKGTVRELLTRVSEEKLEEAIKLFGLEKIIDRDISALSGGELQLVAMAAAYMKDADMYFFDEPTSYLDIYQRLKIAKIIRSVAERADVMTVEHDLAVLDYISDGVFIVYGKPGAYGIFSGYKGVREGINQFLDGVLKEENMKIRDEPIRFEVRPPGEWAGKTYLTYPSLEKQLGDFRMSAEPGEIREGEIIGILGRNGTGKTTFVRMLAGEIKPDNTELAHSLKISYKPQYINFGDTVVRDLFTGKDIDQELLRSELRRAFELDELWDSKASELSGGERQRVAIALTLARDADIYLLDEPSAFLDVDQRLSATKTIKRVIAAKKRAAFVVEHDIAMIDYLADRLIVFSGEPSVEGHATSPLSMEEGMNTFLKELGITFRRDPNTGRPRVNKPGSQKDQEQKKKGQYYYMGA
ncbi:MAG: ribosome biogenesis/translation initiation ATPase RLI [Candidatus Diapherotrites archaeon]|nr:ribosome biogenesis/translation initiation ATPase RLI [Candidatus Diapherotrites archaeon]